MRASSRDLGQRAKERVDGHLGARTGRGRGQANGRAFEDEHGIGRGHIDVILFDHDAFDDRFDRKNARPPEQLGQHAALVRREVLHHDERGAIGGAAQQRADGFEPAGRRADANRSSSLGARGAGGV